MYLFFDTETTGLPRSWKAPVTDLTNWPRMLQLAYLHYDKKGKELSRGNFIVKPEGFIIPPDVSKIHGITHEKADTEGKNLKEVLLHFQELIDDSEVLVAHNMDFDEKIVGAEFLRNKMKNLIVEKKRICTMKSTTEFCGLQGPYGYKWPTLSELHYKLFRTHFKETHNAVVDIMATAKCFWKLKKIGEI